LSRESRTRGRPSASSEAPTHGGLRCEKQLLYYFRRIADRPLSAVWLQKWPQRQSIHAGRSHHRLGSKLQSVEGNPPMRAPQNWQTITGKPPGPMKGPRNVRYKNGATRTDAARCTPTHSAITAIPRNPAGIGAGNSRHQDLVVDPSGLDCHPAPSPMVSFRPEQPAAFRIGPSAIGGMRGHDDLANRGTPPSAASA